MALEEYNFKSNKWAPHYYGDLVRKFFFAGGLTMVITLAFYKHVLPVPSFFSIIAILVVGIAAGITNPRQKWISVLNTGISLVAFIVFEFHAVEGFDRLDDPLFLITQGLAIIFFLALYFSVKTLRGSLLQGK